MNFEDFKNERKRLLEHLGNQEVLDKFIEYLGNYLPFHRLIWKIIKNKWFKW